MHGQNHIKQTKVTDNRLPSIVQKQTRLRMYNTVAVPALLYAARGGAVGWGTALQSVRSWVRFPMRSLGFAIDLILPTVLWSRGRLSLWQKWVLVSHGVKGGRCV